MTTQETQEIQEVPAPPAPPPEPTTVPAPPTVGQVVGVEVPGLGTVIPLTRQQVNALERRTRELSDQLLSAQSRRKELVSELENTSSPAVVTGLEERIKFLDERLMNIEREIAENGALKSSLAAKLGTTPPERTNDGSNNNSSPGAVAGWMALTILGMMYMKRFFKRKGSTAPPSAALSAQTENRINQLEQAIDTVAIEIERVSEGQRYLTRLLNEGQRVPDFSARREEVAVKNNRNGAQP